MAIKAARYAWIAIMLALPTTAGADESAIIADITAFLKTDDLAERRRLVARINADPAYDRAQVPAWLHQTGVFPDLKPGRHEIRVPLRTGSTRTVVLRLPKGYDPHRPWPLIYALHGSGGHSDNIIGYVQKLLGADSDQYVIAAPDSYADLTVHQPEWPPAAEHPAALKKIKQTVNIDSDRVYLAGYSLGGHTSWTLAVLHADQFAGAMPLASTFTIILPDLLWESFLPNLAHLPVLCVWGEADTKYGGERISPEGGIAGVNRKLRELLAQNGLPATMIELPGKGHGEVEPPADEVTRLLAAASIFPRRSAIRFATRTRARRTGSRPTNGLASSGPTNNALFTCAKARTSSATPTSMPPSPGPTAACSASSRATLTARKSASTARKLRS